MTSEELKDRIYAIVDLGGDPTRKTNEIMALLSRECYLKAEKKGAGIDGLGREIKPLGRDGLGRTYWDAGFRPVEMIKL